MRTIILIIFATMLAGTCKAQEIDTLYMQEGFWVLDKYKSQFFYEYTPEETLPKRIENNLSLLLGGAILSGDVEVQGKFVIIKRPKVVQNGNALTPGVQLTLNLQDFFYKPNGKQHKRLTTKKKIQRWTDQLVDMIKQY